jgi:dTDP-4-amino-4,6-dideoxygalactose transaminase
MVPRLPSWESIGRYGRRIDVTRWYSNFGPLVSELEERLCRHFTLEPGSILTVANATLGIAMGLMELAAPGKQCLMPSWTFSATAHAALLAGLYPVFADVDRETELLTPEMAEGFLRRYPGIEAVIVVSPFGMPVSVEDWEQFQRSTGKSAIYQRIWVPSSNGT